VVPVESVQRLVNKLSHQRDIKIDFRKIAGADHYFADRLETIATHVDGYIGEHARPGRATAAPQARGVR
jgi:alpha/beta superfamily hydrolase